jgi:hypothetical protein
MSTLALCIPAYNAAEFLPRLLGSAANQKIPFDEILVYDDCSTDNTADVARQFGATVVSGDRNLGCSSGKNRLLAITRCDWVHFHDADDDMTSEFTTLAHKWMGMESPPDVVLFDYESRSATDGSLILIKQYDAAALRRDAAAYAVRKQLTNFGLYKVSQLRVVGGYDEDPAVLYNEDCRFHMKLAFADLRFAVEPERAVVNLERQNSMSSASRARCAASRLAVLRKAVDEGKSHLRTAIGLEAWLTARQLGYYGYFDEMREAISLARDMGVRQPQDEEKAVIRILAGLAPKFTFLCRALLVKYRDLVLGRNRVTI